MKKFFIFIATLSLASISYPMERPNQQAPAAESSDDTPWQKVDRLARLKKLVDKKDRKALSERDALVSRALKKDDVRLFADLLLYDLISLNTKNQYNQTLFQLATGQGSLDLMQFVHESEYEGNNQDLNAQSSAGFTPLHEAVSQGQHDALALLLRWKADKEIRDDWRRTPLAHAAYKGNAGAVSILVDAGADIDVQDCDKRTPIGLAEQAVKEMKDKQYRDKLCQEEMEPYGQIKTILTQAAVAKRQEGIKAALMPVKDFPVDIMKRVMSFDGVPMEKARAVGDKDKADDDLPGQPDKKRQKLDQ